MFLSQMFNTLTTFEKKLRETSILNNSPCLNVQDLKLLMLGFSEKKQPSTPSPVRDSFQLFFRALPSKAKFLVKMKVLATCHVLLDDIMWGGQFSDQLMQWDGFENKQVFLQIREKDELKNRIWSSYFEFLKRLANSYGCLKLAKTAKRSSIQHFPENVQLYYQTINLLNNLFQQSAILQEVIRQLQDEIVQEIILLIWNDAIALYLFFEKYFHINNRIILEFLVDYQTLQYQIFTQIYELIPDFDQITNRIQNFFLIVKSVKNTAQFQEPIWKYIDKKQQEELARFNEFLRLSNARRKGNMKSSLVFQITPSPNHTHNSTSFNNTTFGYVKRLSTVDDPFATNEDSVSRRFQTLIDKRF